MATNFVVKLPIPPCTYHSVIQKRYGITPRMCKIKYATNATTSCKILVKIGPVVLEEKMLIEIVLRVWHISSNISGCTGPIFTIFYHMKVLYLAMMDLYLIFQFVKGRSMAT